MEARAHRRYRVWLPVRVGGDAMEGVIGEPSVLAVTKDASEGGMSMAATEALEIGARVSITFTVPSDPPVDHRALGTIVRLARNEDDPHGAFPYRVAVQFDAPLEGLADSLADVATELERAK